MGSNEHGDGQVLPFSISVYKLPYLSNIPASPDDPEPWGVHAHYGIEEGLPLRREPFTMSRPMLFSSRAVSARLSAGHVAASW
jgi:hypothetical protein